MGILFILSLFGWAFFIAHFIPGLKPGASIFSAYMAMAALMTLFGLYMGLMRWAAYALIYGGALAFLAFLVRFALSRDQKRWGGWLGPSSVFAFLAGVGLFLITRHLQPTIHDEFSHWAKVVKVMDLFNTSYLRPYSTLAHADYPPALSVLQYAAVRAFGWQEGTLYLVNGLSIIVSFAYLIEDAPWKKVGQAILFMGLAMGFYAIPNRTFSFTSLLIDGPMAIVFATALIKAITSDIEKNREALPVLLASLLLALMKNPSGLLFALAVACCMAFRVKIPQQKFKTGKVLSRALVVVLCLLLVLISYESWNVYYNLNRYKTSDHPGKAPSFSLEMFKGTGEVQQGADAVFGPLTAEKEDIIRTAARSVVKSKLPTARFGGITILLLALISVGLFVTAFVLTQRANRKRVLLLACVLLIVSIGYAIGTYAAYVSHMKAVTEIFRYSGIILIPMLVTPLYFLTRLHEQKLEMRLQLAVAALMVVFLGLGFPWTTWPLLFLPNAHKAPILERNANRYVDTIRSQIVADDHVLVISPFDEATTLDVYSMQYYLLPNYSYLTPAQTITAEKLAQLVKKNGITIVLMPIQPGGAVLNKLPEIPWEIRDGLAVYHASR